MNGDLMNRKTPRRSDRSSGVFEKRVVCSRLWGKKSGRSILSEFKKIVVCELNLGQFASYLRAKFPHYTYYQYNKVAGLPFTVVELKEKITELLGK